MPPLREITTFGANGGLLSELNQQGVRFLIVGGVAVHFHAPERSYDDLDILLDTTPENADRCFRAITAVGLDPQFSVERLTQPRKHISLKHYHYADLVTPAADVSFAAEWECASPATVNNQPVRIASKDLLRRMKSNGDRAKDADDLILLADTNGSQRTVR